jgi:hypothetical protein
MANHLVIDDSSTGLVSSGTAYLTLEYFPLAKGRRVAKRI